jgi:hypothetical protein
MRPPDDSPSIKEGVGVKSLVILSKILYNQPMKKILVSWIGRTDLRAVTEPDTIGQGPIAQALQALPFDQAVLLNNYPPEETSSFIRWLHSIKEIPTTLISVSLTSPTNFAEIYEAVSTAVSKTLDVHGKDAALTFHLSPGTPAMAAIWVLLAKTIFSRDTH